MLGLILSLWTIGVTNAGTAYGASDNYGVALTWDWVSTSNFHGFSGIAYSQGVYTVCTAVSPGGEYAAVEESHRNGRLWWCEDGQCSDVGTGVVFAIDDAGDMAGMSRWTNGVGVVWLDDGLHRWEFPQWQRIRFRDHDWAYVRDQFNNEQWLTRYDCDCDGAVTMFDIDSFVDSLLSGTPTCGAFVIDGFDIDPFVEALTR